MKNGLLKGDRTILGQDDLVQGGSCIVRRHSCIVVYGILSCSFVPWKVCLTEVQELLHLSILLVIINIYILYIEE